MDLYVAHAECHFCDGRGLVAEAPGVIIGRKNGPRQRLAICHDCARNALSVLHTVIDCENEEEDCDDGIIIIYQGA